jgi:hypothetical protein
MIYFNIAASIVAESLLFIAGNIFLFKLINNYYLSFLLMLLGYMYFLKFKKANFYNFIITLLIFIIFTLTIPVMIDRSGTVYMMKLIQSNKRISQLDIQNRMQADYLNKDFIEKRLQEQMIAGNIEKKGELIELTEKGQLFTGLYNFFSQCYQK